jgi:hypothetical protein
MESAMAIMESKRITEKIPVHSTDPSRKPADNSFLSVVSSYTAQKKIDSHVSLSGADHIPTLNAHRSGANIFHIDGGPIKRSKTPFSYPYRSDVPRPRGKFAYKAGVLHINSQLTMNAKKKEEKKCF